MDEHRKSERRELRHTDAGWNARHRQHKRAEPRGPPCRAHAGYGLPVQRGQRNYCHEPHGQIHDQPAGWNQLQLRCHRRLRCRQRWPDAERRPDRIRQLAVPADPGRQRLLRGKRPELRHQYSEVDGHWFKQMQPAFSAKALWTANGNKEYYGHGAWFNVIWAPNNEKWYSYDWGDAHIVVLDSSQPFDPASAQYLWAQADLQANQGSAWRIVVIQDPPYSSTSANSSSMPVETNLVPLFQAQGAAGPVRQQPQLRALEAPHRWRARDRRHHLHGLGQRRQCVQSVHDPPAQLERLPTGFALWLPEYQRQPHCAGGQRDQRRQRRHDRYHHDQCTPCQRRLDLCAADPGPPARHARRQWPVRQVQGQHPAHLPGHRPGRRAGQRGGRHRQLHGHQPDRRPGPPSWVPTRRPLPPPRPSTSRWAIPAPTG